MQYVENAGPGIHIYACATDASIELHNMWVAAAINIKDYRDGNTGNPM